jgi:hypothetical protein
MLWEPKSLSRDPVQNIEHPWFGDGPTRCFPHFSEQWLVVFFDIPLDSKVLQAIQQADY